MEMSWIAAILKTMVGAAILVVCFITCRYQFKQKHYVTSVIIGMISIAGVYFWWRAVMEQLSW